MKRIMLVLCMLNPFWLRGADVNQEVVLPPLPAFSQMKIPSGLCQQLTVSLTRFSDEKSFNDLVIPLVIEWPKDPADYQMAYSGLAKAAYSLGFPLKVILHLTKTFLTIKSQGFHFKARVTSNLEFDTEGTFDSAYTKVYTNWDYRLSQLFQYYHQQFPVDIGTTVVSTKPDFFFSGNQFVSGIAFDQQGREYEMHIRQEPVSCDAITADNNQ